MAKKLFVLLLLIVPFLAFAQQKNDQNIWYLTVADSLTGKGVAGVTVSIKKSASLVTNVNGSVNINKASLSSPDAIKISSIGYKPVMLTLEKGQHYPDTIELSPMVTILKQVNITKSRHNKISIGNIKKACTYNWPLQADMQFAEYIPNNKNLTGNITSIELMVNAKEFGKPFMVDLLSADTSSILPGTDLLRDSLVIYDADSKHLLSVDVSKYKIAFPADGIFIMFRSVPASHKDGGNSANFPGIYCERLDRNAPYYTDKNIPKGIKYSMYKINNDDWVILKGGNLGMGITIAPE